MKNLNIWICNTYKVTGGPIRKIAADFRPVSQPKNLRQLHEVHALKVNCQLSREIPT